MAVSCWNYFTASICQLLFTGQNLLREGGLDDMLDENQNLVAELAMLEQDAVSK